MKNKKILLFVAGVAVVAVGAIVFSNGSGSLFQGAVRSKFRAVETPMVQQVPIEVAQAPLVYETVKNNVQSDGYPDGTFKPSVETYGSNPEKIPKGGIKQDVTHSSTDEISQPTVVPFQSPAVSITPDFQVGRVAFPMGKNVIAPAINLVSPADGASFYEPNDLTFYLGKINVDFQWKPINMPDTTIYVPYIRCFTLFGITDPNAPWYFQQLDDAKPNYTSTKRWSESFLIPHELKCEWKVLGIGEYPDRPMVWSPTRTFTISGDNYVFKREKL